MPNSAENSQISQNLNQNSQNYNFANSNFTHPQTAQNHTNQNENSQISVNLATQNPANTPKNSLENYKKLDYATLSDDEKSEGYIFHILTDKISENSQQKLKDLAKDLSAIYPCEIRIHLIDTQIFENMATFKGNHLANFRILIPHLMPADVKICLYLDTDMLACRDLRELFTLDLSGKVVGAIKDWIGMGHRKWHPKSPKDKEFSIANNFYFNSGFLLINSNEWRRQNVKAKAFDFLLKYEVYCPDQDALNFAIPKQFVLVLPCEFNTLITLIYPENATQRIGYNAQEIEFARVNCVIVHYAIHNEKPWMGFAGTAMVRKFQWWLVALQTPHFTDELQRDLAKLLQGRQLLIDILQARWEKLELELRLKYKQNLGVLAENLERNKALAELNKALVERDKALRFKEHLSYKLGNALINAYKNAVARRFGEIFLV